MKNSIIRINEIISDLNNEIDYLVEQEFMSTDDDTKKNDVEDIRSDIEYIKSLLYGVNSTLGFSKITIRFDGNYQLKLPKFGIEEFDRVLKGDMYFTVLGGNDDFLELRTNSMPKTFKIVLTYETLREFKRQRGDAYLKYKRGRENLEGDSETISFKIIEKS